MDRSSWSALSKDSEIWKKIAIGGSCLMLMFPTPIALGIVNDDLEAEVERIQKKEPPFTDGYLPKVDDILKLLTSGIGPSMVYAGALMMFAIATIPLGLSYFQLYAHFRPVNELVPEMHTQLAIPFTSVLLYFIIAAAGLALQAMVAMSLPVALAQYARGKDLRPALAVIPNALTVIEMGMSYWFKALGGALGLLVMTLVFITGGFGLHWILSTLLCLVVCSLAFVSLVISARFALGHIAAELPPSALPPLPPPDLS